MGRPNYVCTICSEHFTRKFSGKRHNYSIHNGSAVIVPYIEYMAGRNSGTYQASHPSWYRKQRGFRGNQPSIQSHTVADTRSSFQPQSSQQSFQFPYGSANSTQMAQQAKLDELKALLAKYTSQAQGYAIFQRAKSQLGEGDDRFLNDMLNQLRIRDSAQPWRV
jgi:hypothetical protein